MGSLFKSQAEASYEYLEGKMAEHKYILDADSIVFKGGKKSINGKTSDKLSDLDLQDGLLSLILSEEQVNGNTSVSGKETVIEEPSYHESYSNNGAKVFISDALIANKSIDFNCSNVEGTNAYIYSQNGDINLNVGKANFDGFLYAPNGTVYINGGNVTINGAIIAKNIVISTGKFEMNYDAQIAGTISVLNKTKIGKVADLFAFYDEEMNEMGLSYYADFFKSADIYVRYGNDLEFQKFDTTSEIELSIEASDLKDYVDFRVVIKTSFGEEIISTITTLQRTEDGIESIVRDSDGDRIPDGYEIYDLGTDPFKIDTDSDEFDDGYEVFVLHTDPTVPDEDADFDSDGLTNLEEMIVGTNPWLPDSDFDGIKDSKDEKPILTDTNTGKDIDYDVDVKVGKFDTVTQYIDSNGNVNKDIYNYITGENKVTSQGDEFITCFHDKSGNVTTLITNTGDKQIANTFSYDNNGNLITIFHNDLRYDFGYDENDILVHAAIGERILFSNVYDGDKPTFINYGNDDKTEVTYDGDNLVVQKTNGVTTYELTYDENNNLLTQRDVIGDITFTYDYNDENEITSIKASNGFAISYEESDDIYEISYSLNEKTKTQIFESITKDTSEEEPEVVGSIVKLLSNGKLATIITDKNTYTSTITVDEKKILETTYKVDESQVSEIKYSDGTSISYSYDDKGNIVEIYENDKLIESYTYDSLNQLIREDSAKSGITTIYTYDNAGNILETEKFSYTTENKLGELLDKNTYKYTDNEWKDLLTEYNGQAITYDEIGNPIFYRDGFNFTWKNGKQLASLQKDGIEIEYTYDASGIRISKTVNGIKTDYKLNGTTIVAETTNDKTIWYDYDASGMPVGFTLEDTSYYYKKNGQGDIVAILDSDGREVAGYAYDVWGNITHTSGDEDLAKVNPFRYRGYYKDNETGFYYLNTRYYDPESGRFLNADKIEMVSLLAFNHVGANLFTYCYNNPALYSDHTGEGVLPVGGFGYFYKSYKTSVSNWAKKYAPMSKGIEYGAIVYRFRVLLITRYFMGETYKGFKTTNWYTVINGLGAGVLTSNGYKWAGTIFYPVTNVTVVGFAHTHPIGHNNKPSDPDTSLKRLGWIISLKIFPIAVYNNSKISINYF